MYISMGISRALHFVAACVHFMMAAAVDSVADTRFIIDSFSTGNLTLHRHYVLHKHDRETRVLEFKVLTHLVFQIGRAHV